MTVSFVVFVFLIISIHEANAELESGCQEKERNGTDHNPLYPLDTLKHSSIQRNGMFLTNLEMTISIKAPSDGKILLSPEEKPSTATKVFEIVIGGNNNEKFFFRRHLSSRIKDKEKVKPNLLSSSNFTDFYVNISNGTLLVGKVNGSEPLLQYPSIDLSSVKYFGFLTYTGVKGTFRYDCPTAEEKAKADNVSVLVTYLQGPFCKYIIIACCVVTVVVIVAATAIIVALSKRKQTMKNMHSTDINYENLPKHNEGPMPMPCQWTEVSATPVNADNDTYSVPYSTLPPPKTEHSELIYAELQLNPASRETPSKAVKDGPLPKPALTTSKPIVPTKPAALTLKPTQMPEDNYVQVKRKSSLPVEKRRESKDQNYVNCNSDNYVNLGYVNVSKDDCVEPTYCEVNTNK